MQAVNLCAVNVTLKWASRKAGVHGMLQTWRTLCMWYDRRHIWKILAKLIYSRRVIILTFKSHKNGQNYRAVWIIGKGSKLASRAVFVGNSQSYLGKKKISVSFTVWKWEMALQCICASVVLSAYTLLAVFTAPAINIAVVLFQLSAFREFVSMVCVFALSWVFIFCDAQTCLHHLSSSLSFVSKPMKQYAK